MGIPRGYKIGYKLNIKGIQRLYKCYIREYELNTKGIQRGYKGYTKGDTN